jgi:hypothetical protein
MMRMATTMLVYTSHAYLHPDSRASGLPHSAPGPERGRRAHESGLGYGAEPGRNGDGVSRGPDNGAKTQDIRRTY